MSPAQAPTTGSPLSPPRGRPSTRDVILRALGDDEATASAVRDLANRLGYHPNKVREHLEAAGWVMVYKPPRKQETP